MVMWSNRLIYCLAGHSADSTDKVMRQLDVNGDGQVSQEEFVQRFKFWLELKPKSNDEQREEARRNFACSSRADLHPIQATQVFKEIDADGNGLIDAEELKSALHEQGELRPVLSLSHHCPFQASPLLRWRV